MPSDASHLYTSISQPSSVSRDDDDEDYDSDRPDNSDSLTRNDYHPYSRSIRRHRNPCTRPKIECFKMY